MRRLANSMASELARLRHGTECCPGHRGRRTESCLPSGSVARHAEVQPPVHHEESDSTRRGRRLFPSINAGAATPCATGLTGIACTTRPRSACRASNASPAGAVADVHAMRALPQQATDRAAAMVTPRQALALQLLCDGPRWRPSRELLALASAESPRIRAEFPCHCSWKGATACNSASAP